MWADFIATYEASQYENEAVELLEKAIGSESRKFDPDFDKYRARIEAAISLILNTKCE